MKKTKKHYSEKASYRLELSFDVGHSSIGWAVIQPGVFTDVKGCGVITFQPDGCLASQRRAFRRQRRHIRGVRKRISYMKTLLDHIGVLSKKNLEMPGCSWPWLLAARVLVGHSTLRWKELWDVLRWYAHNRGYDGNRQWARSEDVEAEDIEKVQLAQSLMKKHNTKTMAETVCRVMGLNPAGKKKSSQIPFKSLSVAFPRDIVENEVTKILRAHIGKLKGVNDILIRCLLANPEDAEAWRVIPCPDIGLSNRYKGGLLFGQIIPRFNNRVISICPISGEKVPLRNTSEFLNFRWGMQLANVRVSGQSEHDLRQLSPAERKEVDDRIRQTGYFTKTQFMQCVRNVTNASRDNLETMLMHPDAEKALFVDPAKKAEQSGKLKPFWLLLPKRLQLRINGRLRRGKKITLAGLRNEIIELGENTDAFDAQAKFLFDDGKAKSRKKKQEQTFEEWMGTPISAEPIPGRAPYARPIMRKAFEEVMAGKHPAEEEGCLFLSESVRKAQLDRRIEEQTNNHLIRHRLLILKRLMNDIIKEYAGGDKSRVGKITIEVNRDLREMSGKTAKEKAAELGRRLSNHRQVSQKLTDAFAESNVKITAGLIRKARIAEDLGWQCPYTGQFFEPAQLLGGVVDKDHIVPRSQRQSDALEALVITFKAINEWKDNRTAWEFVRDEQGKPVPGMPQLSIISLARYEQFIDKLDTRKGHNDDRRRKKKRKQLMLLRQYDEPEFVPRDLTVTSQLARMGAQVIRHTFANAKTPPNIVSMPGSVTGFVRRKWNLFECLSQAAPGVLDDDGTIKTKTDIRDITHLHHAVDACILGLTARFIPNEGSVWAAMTKRRLDSGDRRMLEELGVFHFGVGGRFDLRDLDPALKKNVADRLKERRVVQHIPARMDGLRVEQNIWRVLSVNEGRAQIQQKASQDDRTRKLKQSDKNITKLLGISPRGSDGKLRRLKGALVISENFGVVLDPEPFVIPFHKVWPRLMEVKKANHNRMPRILRNGHTISVPKGRYQGAWRVFSVKNNANGINLDIGPVDAIKANETNVLLRTLLNCGMTIDKRVLTGSAACHTTSST